MISLFSIKISFSYLELSRVVIISTTMIHCQSSKLDYISSVQMLFLRWTIYGILFGPEFNKIKKILISGTPLSLSLFT